jgi:putative endonuclease
MSVDPRRALGAHGEDAAARAYLDRGWRVVDRNWRCREGELDLIMWRAGVIAFCEVKTRTSDRFGGPAAAVTLSKQARIRRLAMRWMAETDKRAARVRFDVAVVQGNEVRIIEGAF